MIVRRRKSLLLVIAVCAVSGACASQTFPEWRGSNLEIAGAWKESPIVAVGDVTNVAPYGEEKVGTLPWPMSPEVHTLYWCTGDFRLTAIVKGELHTRARKYLWASSQPGCKIWYGDAQ